MNKKLRIITFICFYIFGMHALGEEIPFENKNTPSEEETKMLDEAQNIIKSSSDGREVIVEKQGEFINNDEKDSRLYKNETILNWHYSFQKENKRNAEVVGKNEENSLIKNVSGNENDKAEAGKDAEKTAQIKGYCFITDEINIGKQQGSLRTECQTNYGAVTLFGNLVNVNEKASLVLDVKYIEKNGYRFQVVESIVTNEEKTSYNIATYVNDRKISQVALESVSQASQEVKTYTNQYLKALEQSRIQQQMIYANSSSGTIGYVTPMMATNTLPPDPLHYLATAGVNIATSAAKSTADIFKKDLPYLYQIVAKTKIWIDIKVKEDGEYVK